VEAAKRSLARYVAGLEAVCAFAGVRYRCGVDVAKEPEVLSGFDHLVVATGGAYRPGLGVIATALLSTGMVAGPALAVCAAAVARFSLLSGAAPDG